MTGVNDGHWLFTLKKLLTRLWKAHVERWCLRLKMKKREPATLVPIVTAACMRNYRTDIQCKVHMYVGAAFVLKTTILLPPQLQCVTIQIVLYSANLVDDLM